MFWPLPPMLRYTERCAKNTHIALCRCPPRGRRLYIQRQPGSIGLGVAARQNGASRKSADHTRAAESLGGLGQQGRVRENCGGRVTKSISSIDTAPLHKPLAHSAVLVSYRIVSYRIGCTFGRNVVSYCYRLHLLIEIS